MARNLSAHGKPAYKLPPIPEQAAELACILARESAGAPRSHVEIARDALKLVRMARAVRRAIERGANVSPHWEKLQYVAQIYEAYTVDLHAATGESAPRDICIGLRLILGCYSEGCYPYYRLA